MVPVQVRMSGVSRSAAYTLSFALTAAAFAVPAAANQPVVQTVAAPAAAPVAAAPAQAPDAAKSRTRFVFFLDKKVPFQVLSLQNPNRVVIDLPEVAVHLPTMPAGQSIGLVKSVRGGLAAAGKTKVEIHVTDPVVVESATIEPSKDGRTARFVLQMIPADPKQASAARKAMPGASLAGLGTIQPPMPKAAERPEARAARAFKRTIVLDPGHGGHDGGATRNGAIEKEVVLLFGLSLRQKLMATGRYNVLMTRDTDKFIPLSDRREFGERNNAALFIAIHADYAPGAARGATIYSLRDNVANELKRSAKGEIANNVLDGSKMRQSDERDAGAVKGILSDLAQMEVEVTKQRTNLFSRSVIEYMGAQTNMMSNPDRQAAFAVLRTAKVPAVLIELAFVSNKEDAAKLKSDEWRNKVADSIMTAIDNYFSHQLAANPYLASGAGSAEQAAAPSEQKVRVRTARRR